MMKQQKKEPVALVQQMHNKRKQINLKKLPERKIKRKQIGISRVSHIQLMAIFLFELAILIFIISCAASIFYYKANNYGSDSVFKVSRTNIKKYYKKINTTISLPVKDKEEDEDDQDPSKDKIYTVNIYNNRCVSENDVKIDYDCSERYTGVYDRYTVSVSGNNIVIDKIYNNYRGTETKYVDLIIDHRNVESINDYLATGNNEKTLEFTKYVYDNAVQRTRQEPEEDTGEEETKQE